MPATVAPAVTATGVPASSIARPSQRSEPKPWLAAEKVTS
jgi:hypothetical protein